MINQDSGEAVRHVVANETQTRYVLSNPFCDSHVMVHLRTNSEPPRAVTNVKVVSYPTGWHIALVFPEPPGEQTFVVEITPCWQ